MLNDIQNQIGALAPAARSAHRHPCAVWAALGCLSMPWHTRSTTNRHVSSR